MYTGLHAFSLKDSRLSVREVVNLRFYASRQYKAFQDEADIYFDTEYIYSPRVSKLLFVKNGTWQTLKESPHPGLVQIQSDEKDLDFISYNPQVKAPSRTTFPVEKGVYVFSFSAPDKLPYVDIGNMEQGGVLVFNVDFPKTDSSALNHSNITITADSVQAIKILEEAEALYDSFSVEVDKNVKRIDTTEFSGIYPPLKPAASVGLTDSSADYRDYVSRYNLKRGEAQTLWRSKKLGEVSLVYKMFRAKFDSLQALPLLLNMIPSAVEKIEKSVEAAKSDSAKADSAKADIAKPTAVKADSLKLTFGVDRARVDVSWKGVVEGYPMDSLAAKLVNKDANVVTTLHLMNNKPVWVFKEGNLVGRYHYRYDKISFRVGDSVYYGKGEFKLPMYLGVENEVRNWLKNKSSISSSSAIAGSSSSSAETSKDSTSKADRPGNIVEHLTRGTVAVVDSGSFRYRGKVVSMSPYAIHTTEVTQEFFNKVMGTLDSTKRVKEKSVFKGDKKPVQNINWKNAQYFCKVLGGDLPTEAQWEFAGRAGGNEGLLWTSGDALGVNKYAVYATNSMKMGKKSEAYGPHDVASKTPNAWGLYDMSGNVAEWTRDNYFAITFSIEDSNPTGSYWGTNKVLKGGSWKDKEAKLNMTARDDEDPRYWSDGIGFRCVFPLERIIQEK